MKTTLLTLMAMQYLNCPYRWASNGPFEFDCSGLVLKVLHDVGLTLPDQTAQSIYNYCEDNGTESTDVVCDSLLFFGSSTTRITHIGISMGEIDGVHYMINASGGGRETESMSIKELAEKDARVKIERVSRRRDLVASILIPYK